MEQKCNINIISWTLSLNVVKIKILENLLTQTSYFNTSDLKKG